MLMHSRMSALMVGIAMVGVACGSGRSADEALSASAAAVCADQVRQQEDATDVIRAEHATAGEVVAWWSERSPVPGAPQTPQVAAPYAEMDNTTQVTVCVLGGSFHTPTGPPAPGTGDRPAHDAAIQVVDQQGTATLVAAGYRGELRRPVTPSDQAR